MINWVVPHEKTQNRTSDIEECMLFVYRDVKKRVDQNTRNLATFGGTLDRDLLSQGISILEDYFIDYRRYVE